MQRRVYCVGLRKHVEADIDDIVPITGKRGTKYQCVGKYSENGKDYVVKSWVPKADYEDMHGPLFNDQKYVGELTKVTCDACGISKMSPEVNDNYFLTDGLCPDCDALTIDGGGTMTYNEVMGWDADSEEFNGADVEAAEPLAADPVADSPVAEDSSEPLEVAPADKSYFLSESVVLSAIKEMAAEDEEPPETITYDCISCGEEIDDEDGHELVGEFQEKCCLPCFKTAFGAENRQPPWSATNPKPQRKMECGECDAKGFIAGEECTTCDGAGYWKIPAPRCATCDSDIEWTDGAECDDCEGWVCNDCLGEDYSCPKCKTTDLSFHAEQTFEAQQKDRKDYVSEQAALRLIKGAYGVKRIVSGPTYYRFVEGTSSKFLMFAVVERNNGTFQAVNVYGRRGANFPTLWTSDPYSTEAQAERASKAKQNKKSRKGYVFLDAEEFRAFMAEHFNSETLNSSESIDNYMSESPLDESPVDEDPLTADPSDLGGPEDFSADATIDLEDGEITIHEKGAKSGGSKKLLLGVILVAGLAAAYQNSDAVLEFFEGLKGDEADPILGCMDETANNYDATATEDDGTCTYDPDDEATA
jgi:predicted DNA-binding WGR domain protein